MRLRRARQHGATAVVRATLGVAPRRRPVIAGLGDHKGRPYKAAERLPVPCWALLCGLLLALAPLAAQLPADDNPSPSALLDYLGTLPRGPQSWVSAVSLGQSSGGRTIPAVMAYDPTQSPLALRRVLVLARQHGNEPAGTAALLGLLREVVAGDATLRRQLRRVCLIAVPMVNPDGAESGQRHNGRNVDLNRDWSKLSQPETQAVERLAGLWKPDVVIDLHELHPNDRYGQNTVEAPQPNVTGVPAADETRRLQAFVLARLTAAGFTMRPSFWAPGASAGLCHRHFGTGVERVCLLFESERQHERTPLARRVAMHRAGLAAVLTWFAGEAPAGAGALVLPSPLTGPTPDALGAVADDEGAAVKASALADSPTPSPLKVVGVDLSQPLRGRARFSVAVADLPAATTIVVKVDGTVRFVSSNVPADFSWETSGLARGPHTLTLQAQSATATLAERHFTVDVQAP